MAKPIAVISGDIHYNLQNLPLADAATRSAINKANELSVPFIANGDTQDQKANLRAECVNSMIETFKLCNITPYVSIGNHCKINEKSEAHALNFLAPYATIVPTPTFFDSLQAHLIPYQHDVSKFIDYVSGLPYGSRLIIHQGIEGSLSGDYIQDRTAIQKSILADFRTIASHYHARQDIECGPPGPNLVGIASYIGSPYTQNYGEAHDLNKGFQILYDDGSLEFVPTNLRKHRVFEFNISAIENVADIVKEIDLVWIKIKGPSDALAKLTKSDITELTGITQAYRLDLIPTEASVMRSQGPKEDLSQEGIFDQLIDSLSNTDNERKDRLKALWKEFTTKG